MEISKASSAEIRKINRSRIFRYLYDNGAQSRKSISNALQLSMPTVVQNLKEMDQQGLTEEAGVLASTGGRKAVAVQLNYHVKYTAGLDITRSHFGIVILNIKGEVLYQRRMECLFVQQASYFKNVCACLEQGIDSLRIDRSRILGVGISVPAIISADADSLDSSFILSPDLTLSCFKTFLPYPCRLCNDAKAASKAEQQASKEQTDFIYLCLSSSVGGAIVQHGLLCEGVNRRSAEFGHMTIVPNGKPCYCGKRGCFDAYCNSGLLTRHSNGSLDQFFTMVDQGDPDANEEWNRYLEYLSVMVNNLRMAFDDTIVLGGYVGCYIGRYLPKLRAMVSERNTFARDGEFLKKCHYDNFEASAVGAAYAFLEPFLQQI